ncbi:MAG: sulfite exporter TauE/SafE family protein [Methanomicrobia archaeon]|nr:sulfite exporter TauE/SafE family protein [Methanomicrobia archaeon]
MIDYLTYWYLFPVSIGIAILAMSAGISGSNFWIPVYLIWLKIEPKTGFWLALLTMIFGFGSGVIKNLKQETINWYLVKQYLKITIPAGIFGTVLVPFAPAQLLIVIFASFVLLYGASTIYRCCNGMAEEAESHETIYWARAALAGFIKGLIATGLGKLILPAVLGHRKIKSPAEAVGSTVVVIFVVNIVAVLFRFESHFYCRLSGKRNRYPSYNDLGCPGRGYRRADRAGDRTTIAVAVHESLRWRVADFCQYFDVPESIRAVLVWTP